MEIPKPYPSAFNDEAMCCHDIVNRIMKFIYHNQEFASIKAELNDENISQMLSQATVMECWHLKEHLDEYLINEVLTPDNVSHHYLDAIAFGSEKVKKACEDLIL